jgi:hypothetical protein
MTDSDRKVATWTRRSRGQKVGPPPRNSGVPFSAVRQRPRRPPSLDPRSNSPATTSSAERVALRKVASGHEANRWDNQPNVPIVLSGIIRRKALSEMEFVDDDYQTTSF